MSKLAISTTVAVIAIVVVAIVAGAAGYFGGAAQAPVVTTTVKEVETTTLRTTVTKTEEVTTTVTAPGVVGKLKIAVVVPGLANDMGWNQMGVEGGRVAAKYFKAAEFSFSEGLGYGEEPLRAMEDYIRKGYDLVIAHAGGYVDQAIKLVEEGKAGKTKFLIVLPGKPGEDLIPGKLATYSFEVHPPAYPAGYLAGLLTKSNVVGIIQSVEEDTYWCRMSGAFAQGLKAANPDAKLLFSVVGSYEDPVKAKEFTLAQIGLGADVIFGMGDGTSFGIMEATSEKGVWFIDVIGDKRAIDEKGILLTSVLWDFSVAYKEAIADIYNGEFGKKDYPMSIANGGAHLMEINPKVPGDIVAKVGEISKKVAAGEIKVKFVATPEELYDLFKELGYQ